MRRFKQEAKKIGEKEEEAEVCVWDRTRKCVVKKVEASSSRKRMEVQVEKYDPG